MPVISLRFIIIGIITDTTGITIIIVITIIITTSDLALPTRGAYAANSLVSCNLVNLSSAPLRGSSGRLFQEEAGYTIIVEGAKIVIPTGFAIPLGFIANELITNSAKYAKSNITVRLETTPTIGHSLSVLDDGPGLPAGFDPAESQGLGMKIIGSLVNQIAGKLQFAPGENGQGARFTVTFHSGRPSTANTPAPGHYRKPVMIRSPRSKFST